MSKKQLARELHITPYRLRIWLEELKPEIGPTKHLRFICVKIILIIFDRYGAPEGYDNIDK